jgi:hypothetical protein
VIKLDDDLLQELGLAGLPPEEKKKLLAHIYETLEMRVGMKLAEQMSDAQLTEFEQFIDRNDEGGALKWLETNFPNYKDVVAAEFERLKTEIGQVAPQIIAAGAAQQPPAAPTAPQPGFQPSQPMQPPAPQQWQNPAQPPAAPSNPWDNQPPQQQPPMPPQPNQPYYGQQPPAGPGPV